MQQHHNQKNNNNQEETKVNHNGNPSYPQSQSTEKYGFQKNALYNNYVKDENYDDWEASQNPSNGGKRGKWTTEQVIYDPNAPDQGSWGQDDGSYNGNGNGKQGQDQGRNGGNRGRGRGNRGRGGGYRGRGGNYRGGNKQGGDNRQREGADMKDYNNAGNEANNHNNQGNNAGQGQGKQYQGYKEGGWNKNKKGKNKNNGNNYNKGDNSNNNVNNNGNYNGGNSNNKNLNHAAVNQNQQNNSGNSQPHPNNQNNNKNPQQQQQQHQQHQQKQQNQQKHHHQQQHQQKSNKDGMPSNGVAMGMTIEQFKAFQEQYAELMKQLEENKDKPEKFQLLTKQYERRMAMAEKQAKKNLPIYPKRKEIMDHFLHNKFTIVVGDTGCGKSTQLPQYLFEHYEQIPGSKILWVLPRKLPVLSLSQRVCEEMEVQIGGSEVGFEVPNKKKCFPNTLLKFTTDTLLINELIEKRARAGLEGKIKLDYSLVVLDEVHERNLYTDILLTTLKEIASETDMKLLVTSATINEALFEHYFNTKAIQVKGRPYPVDITYNPIIDAYKAIDHVANVVFNITRDMKKVDYEYRGHILVFTSGVDDIIKIKTKLIEEKQINTDKFEVLPLHGLLAPDEQQAIFQNTKKSKIILATRIAETALTIDGVRVVIDIGYDKETIYDSIKRMTIIENKPIPQSSAIQRAGRAGRTSPGMCVRLYSIEDFTKMEKNKISEIQRMNLGTVILKLKAIGVTELRKFDFIEKPNEQVLVQTIQHLKELEALDRNTEELTLTGQAMLKLETDPDFSKVILEGLKRKCEREVIEIIAMVGVNPRLYNRGYDDDKREAADKKKLGFCHEKGDLLTLLEIYKFWCNRSKPERQKWCTTNCFSYHALNEAYKTTKDLNRNLDVVRVIYKGIQARARQLENARNQNQNQGQNQPVNPAQNEEQNREDNILKCFLTAFYTNVCQYTNYAKIGYTLLRDGSTLRLHGASSVSLAQDYPPYLFCIDINKTTFTNSKLVSVIQKNWLDELFPGYRENPTTKFLADSFTFSYCTIPRLSKMLLGNFAFKKKEIKTMAEEFKTTFCPEFDQEQLHAYSSLLGKDELYQQTQSVLDDIRANLQDETREVPVTLKTRAIFKEGGEVTEILFSSTTRSFRIDGLQLPGGDRDKQKVEELIKGYGPVVSISFDSSKISKLWSCVVIMRSFTDAEKALKNVNENAIRGIGIQMTRAKVNPIPYELTGGTKRSLRLTIEWSVGQCERDVLLIYENEGSANQVYENLLSAQYMLQGQVIVVNKWGKNAKVLCVQRVNDRKNLLLKNVFDSVDEIDLEIFLGDWGLSGGLKKIIKFRKDDYDDDSRDEVTAGEHEEYVRTMVKSLDIKDIQILRIEASKKHQYEAQAEYGSAKKQNHKNYKRKVFVDVLDIEIARKILDYFENNNGLIELTKEKTRCEMSLSTGFTLKPSKYAVVEQELKVLINQLHGKKNGVKIFVDEKRNFFDPKMKEMSIRIVAQDIMNLDECSETLDSVLLGAPFYLNTINHTKKMEENKTKNEIDRIEKVNGVSIDYLQKRRMLKVFGPQENRKKALDQLDKLLNNGPDLGYKQVKVSFMYKSVRHLFEKNEALLQEVRNTLGVKITYTLRTKEILISGPAEKVSDAESRVKEMVNKHVDRDGVPDNACGICQETILEGFRLQVCGHKFCFVCLEGDLTDLLNENPEFPLCCFQCKNEGKKIAICLKDLEQVFTEGTRQTLWDRSVEAFVKKNGNKYYRCYTNKCPQVFRIENNTEFSCDYCLQTYQAKSNHTVPVRTESQALRNYSKSNNSGGYGQQYGQQQYGQQQYVQQQYGQQHNYQQYSTAPAQTSNNYYNYNNASNSNSSSIYGSSAVQQNASYNQGYYSSSANALPKPVQQPAPVINNAPYQAQYQAQYQASSQSNNPYPSQKNYGTYQSSSPYQNAASSTSSIAKPSASVPSNPYQPNNQSYNSSNPYSASSNPYKPSNNQPIVFKSDQSTSAINKPVAQPATSSNNPYSNPQSQANSASSVSKNPAVVTHVNQSSTVPKYQAPASNYNSSHGLNRPAVAQSNSSWSGSQVQNPYYGLSSSQNNSAYNTGTLNKNNAAQNQNKGNSGSNSGCQMF